jgi:hypothetical protein
VVVEKAPDDAFDSAGRPIVHEDRRIQFKGLSANCGKVLYALALTELVGNKLGLTRRSIRKILEHEEDPLAGTWDWLFDPDVRDSDAPITHVTVRNAVQKILTEYPITVLKTGTYVDIVVPGYLERLEGGAEPDVYVLNEGAIERWPCRARIITLLSIGIPINPIRYNTLSRYMPASHCSHILPKALQDRGATAPESHALREDIEFLVRSRYLKLFTHERGDRRRREIAYAQPLEFEVSAIIELDERARWEQTYLQRLARHFLDRQAKDQA